VASVQYLPLTTIAGTPSSLYLGVFTVTEVQVVDVELITKQFHHLQADIDFKVVKIGLLCASEQLSLVIQAMLNTNLRHISGGE
jgi:hydroxymethylpyrimidine/phosphomethylpyrimidine kinase